MHGCNTKQDHPPLIPAKWLPPSASSEAAGRARWERRVWFWYIGQGGRRGPSFRIQIRDLFPVKWLDDPPSSDEDDAIGSLAKGGGKPYRSSLWSGWRWLHASFCNLLWLVLQDFIQDLVPLSMSFSGDGFFPTDAVCFRSRFQHGEVHR